MLGFTSLRWVAWVTNSDQLCDLRQSIQQSIQLIGSPAMKDHNTDSSGLKGGLEVINFLTLAQQGHNL